VLVILREDRPKSSCQTLSLPKSKAMRLRTGSTN
jgi:hypothetical protein